MDRVWVRYAPSTRQVVAVSVPPFTVPAAPDEADIHVEDTRPHHKVEWLKVSSTLDGFVLDVPQAELDEQAKRQKRRAAHSVLTSGSVQTLAQLTKALQDFLDE